MGDGGCSAGESGGSSGGVGGAAARPVAAAVVVVELRWKLNPVPGVGFDLSPPPGLGRRRLGRSGCGRVEV